MGESKVSFWHRNWSAPLVKITCYFVSLFQDCISLGSGEPNRSSYHSFVLYHSNSPRWGEIIKLPIPIDRFRGSHLRFEFRHCSSEWDFSSHFLENMNIPLLSGIVIKRILIIGAKQWVDNKWILRDRILSQVVLWTVKAVVQNHAIWYWLFIESEITLCHSSLGVSFVPVKLLKDPWFIKAINLVLFGSW
jgi:hypothetical protein